MLEDSVESFVLQWRPYAAKVTLFAHAEGNPLLECRVATAIFHVLERTGPYHSRPGSAQLIVHPVAETVQRVEDGGKKLDVRGISQIAARGIVLVKEEHMVVLDAGAPLVVGVFGGIAEEVALGDWLEFESLAPVHGFLVPPPRRAEAAGNDGI